MTPVSIQFLDDQAVYRRTAAGQRELVGNVGRLSLVERRFLSVVTGHTPLRVLLDMGMDEPGIGEAIVTLVERRFIKLENPQT